MPIPKQDKNFRVKTWGRKILSKSNNPKPNKILQPLLCIAKNPLTKANDNVINPIKITILKLLINSEINLRAIINSKLSKILFIWIKK